MLTKTVEVLCDIHCSCPADGHKPVYRIFVGEELFSERTWLWTDFYLEENLTIIAPIGHYKINIVLLKPEDNKHTSFKPTNIRVSAGDGRILKNGMLEVI